MRKKLQTLTDIIITVFETHIAKSLLRFNYRASMHLSSHQQISAPNPDWSAKPSGRGAGEGALAYAF